MSDYLDEIEELAKRIEAILVNKIKPYILSLKQAMDAKTPPESKDSERIMKIEKLWEQYDALEKAKIKDIKDKDILRDYIIEIKTMDEMIKDLKALAKSTNNEEIFDKELNEIVKDEDRLEQELLKLIQYIQRKDKNAAA